MEEVTEEIGRLEMPHKIMIRAMGGAEEIEEIGKANNKEALEEDIVETEISKFIFIEVMAETSEIIRMVDFEEATEVFL